MFFSNLGELVREAAEGVRPAEELNVHQAAEKYLRINNPGSYVGPYDSSITPYMREPMEVMTSISYRAMIFAAPAQCGKTAMFDNWMTYSVVCDPADMMLIQTVQATARDFSIRRIQNRMMRHAPEVRRRILNSRDADNVFDKQFSNGMMVNFSWPSINELSGRSVPRLFLTDYDRMDQDVDGEGSPFKLAEARATTFGRHGMTVAESSPGFVHTNTQWVPGSKHEAPPCEGILSLYNRGDRRRWYWRCVSCASPFEPAWELMVIPDSADIMEAAEASVMHCPHCGQVYTHDQSTDSPGKTEMNSTARWVKDGQLWLPNGEMSGEGIRSETASFWLQGTCAAFNTWTELVKGMLEAEREYESNGSEVALKAHTNTKLGLPYTPKAHATMRLAATLQARAKEIGRKEVPYGGRFLIATVDVQKKKFVVQVHAVFDSGDVAVIDRFDMKYSRRPQQDRPDQLCFINAAAYAEDWRLLLDEVMLKTYPLPDGSGRTMGVKLTLCDSGGRDGVTSNAYEFVRWLRDGYGEMDDPDMQDLYPHTPGMEERFQLIKGENKPAAPTTRISYPDSQRKDRRAEARGEIPVMILQTDNLKNKLDGMLDRTTEGAQILFPKWLPINFYKELTVEVKNDKGQWVNPNNYRNESWDLLVYMLAGLRHHEVRANDIAWEDPPYWAEEWDTNSLVFGNDEHKPLANDGGDTYSLSQLGEELI